MKKILIISYWIGIVADALASVLVARSHFIPLPKLMPMFVLYVVVYVMFIPSYIWAKREHRNS
jgi:hypothetical protein